MKQYKKIVLEAPKGMNYIINEEDNGKVVIRLIPDEIGTHKTIKSLSEEVSEDRYKFFTKISNNERQIVEEWLENQEPKNSRERRFLNRLSEALEEINYTYWIATISPGVKDGKIFYAEAEVAERGYMCKEWKKMARNYAQERGSRLSNLNEIVIWYAICKIKQNCLRPHSNIVLNGDDDYSLITNLCNLTNGVLDFMVEKRSLLPAEFAIFATGTVVLTK